MIPYINITNHRNEQIFVYHLFDNSLFQIGIIHPNQCILKTIPMKVILDEEFGLFSSACRAKMLLKYYLYLYLIFLRLHKMNL